MSDKEQKDETNSEHCGSGSDSTGLVSLREVQHYFFQDEYESCKEYSDLFVNRLLETGFDNTVNPRLRYWLNIWALAEPGEEAGKAADEINAYLATS